LDKLLKYFNLFLNAFAAMVYIGIGIFVLGGWLKLAIPPIYLTLLGILLVLYGAFRSYRFYVKFIKKEAHE